MIWVQILFFVTIAAFVGMGFASESDRKRMAAEKREQETINEAAELLDLMQRRADKLEITVVELREENTILRARYEDVTAQTLNKEQA